MFLCLNLNNLEISREGSAKFAYQINCSTFENMYNTGTT